jgi:hypothetical protein
MHSARSYLFFTPAVILLMSVFGCTSAEQREADLKKSRLERIWTTASFDSLKGMHYQKILGRMGQPERDNWYAPDFGTLVYDSLQTRLDPNAGVRIQSIMVTIRKYHVAEVDTL